MLQSGMQCCSESPLVRVLSQVNSDRAPSQVDCQVNCKFAQVKSDTSSSQATAKSSQFGSNKSSQLELQIQVKSCKNATSVDSSPSH